VARDSIAVDMSPADVATALRRAREFKSTFLAKLQAERQSQ
jgi:hypothetical protein